MSDWGVTMVVVPDMPGAPRYIRGKSTTWAVGLFTAALGRAPSYQDQAWVWSVHAAAPDPVAISATEFSSCTSGAADTRAAGDAAASCVLHYAGH